MPFVATLASLPTRIKLVVGLAILIAALLTTGIPPSTFAPFAGLAACLGMHLFMGHGHSHSHSHSHGDRQSESDERRPEPDHGTGPVELRTLDR